MKQFWRDITHPEAVAFLNSSVVSQYPILQKYMNSSLLDLTHEEKTFLFSAEYWKDFYFKEKFYANFWGRCSFSVQDWHEDDWKFRSDFTGLFSMFLAFPQSMEGIEDYISFDNVLFMQYEIDDIFHWCNGDYSFLNTRKTDKIFVREFGRTESKSVGDIVKEKLKEECLFKPRFAIRTLKKLLRNRRLKQRIKMYKTHPCKVLSTDCQVDKWRANAWQNDIKWRLFKPFFPKGDIHKICPWEIIEQNKTMWKCKAPEKEGVYFFFQGNAIVYIGQSKNIKQRLYGHGDAHNHDAVSWVEGHEAFCAEDALIGFYNPENNRSFIGRQDFF